MARSCPVLDLELEQTMASGTPHAHFESWTSLEGAVTGQKSRLNPQLYDLG